jgi:hypothetical protein
MDPALNPFEIAALAAVMCLLAGWRLYLVVLATGLAIAAQAVPLPERLWALEVLADPWVLRLAAFGALCEFVADKVARLDSLWDTVHAVVRPLGGAALALAMVDPGDPLAQVLTLLLGGGAALLTHAGKVAARRMVDRRPGRRDNLLVSAAEDVGTIGLLWLAYAFSAMAAAIAAGLAILAILLLLGARFIGQRRHYRMPPMG